MYDILSIVHHELEFVSTSCSCHVGHDPLPSYGTQSVTSATFSHMHVMEFRAGGLEARTLPMHNVLSRFHAPHAFLPPPVQKSSVQMSPRISNRVWSLAGLDVVQLSFENIRSSGRLHV